MYIEGRYWNNYIGDTEDSLLLVDYLAEKQKKEITAEEIFTDFHVDRLHGDFKSSFFDDPSALVYTDPEGLEWAIDIAICLITDLAALLLECKVNGYIDLNEVATVTKAATPVRITATPEEHDLINRTLKDFVSNPLSYDLSNMCSEEEMQETAEICEALRKELYEK